MDILTKFNRKAVFMEEEKKKSNKALIVILIIVIIALVGIVVFLLNNKKNNNDDKSSNSISQESEQDKRNVVVNEENAEEVLDNMLSEQKVVPGNYEVTMNTTWYFPDSKSPSTNAYVENSTANNSDVYFDILLADTEEKIYSSPLLPIGSHLENVTLEKELSAGNYDCVMVYTLVDANQTPLSELRVGFKIIIEN